MLPTLRTLGAHWRLRLGPKARFVIKAALSLLIVAALLWFVDVRRVLAVLSGIEPGWAIAACGLFLLGQGLNALKWLCLGEALALPFAARDYLRVYAMGMFLTVFLPGSLGGDVGRAVLLGKSERGWGTAYSVLADRYSGMLFLLVLGAVAALGVDAYAALRPWLFALTGAVVGAWLLLGLVGFYLRRRPFKLSQRITDALAEIVRWEAALRQPGVLLRVGALTLLVQLANAGVLVLIALALKLSASAAALLTAYALITVATLAPVSINGLGLREGGYVLLLGLVGVPADQAIAFSALWFAVYTACALLGGLAWWVPGQTPLRAE